MTNETPAQRLGRYVRARRKELKMTQVDVQEAGGPSTATLRLIEGGKHADFRDGTGTALESALKWAYGSIDDTLTGGEPTPLDGGRARSWMPADGVRDFWAVHARPDLPDLRALSPETVHRLLTTARHAREALSAALNSDPSRDVVEHLGTAAEAVASSADIAAIESFGGAYEFSRSMPALREYIKKEQARPAQEDDGGGSADDPKVDPLDGLGRHTGPDEVQGGDDDADEVG